MSPLVAAGVQGYADWQRVDNYDTVPLYNVNGQAISTFIDTPVLNVSRFAYAAGIVTALFNAILVRFVWFADPAITVTMGSRDIVVTPSISNGLQFRLPNLGSFLVVEFRNMGGASPSMNTRIAGSNRAHPLEFVPESALLVDQQAVAIAGSGTNTHYPSDYYAGPCQVSLLTNFANGSLTFFTLTTGGAWHIFDQKGINAVGDFTYIEVMPSSAWRVDVGNSTVGASNYTLAVVPSTTGAT